MPADWLADLREYLCRIYKEWGGDCATLPFMVEPRVAALWDCFNAKGVPALADQNKRDAYRKLLVDTRDCLDRPENTLETAVDSSLRSLLDTLLAAVAQPV
jgi:hypothetical protein